MKFYYLISGFLLMFHIITTSTLASTVNEEPVSSSNDEFTVFLGKALSLERKLISSITKEHLLEMSGLSLVQSKHKHRNDVFSKDSSDWASSDQKLNVLSSKIAKTFHKKLDQQPEGFSGETVDHLLLADLDIQVKCLAEAMYFESRGENILGQYAVAEVILNRVDSNEFPNSVCKVVSEGSTRLHACQFSYNCDGKPEYVNDLKSYERILKLSNMLYGGTARILTDGATFYHSNAVLPSWTAKMKKTSEIGRHIFYRPEKRIAQN